MSLTRLLREVRACQICSANLPLGPRPVLQLASSARLLIIGQAPGSKVHQSGIPWSDASGDRLRDWLQMDRSVFYDKAQVAILPMGFCYPGAGESRGDLPPRPECAPLWHERLLKHLPNLKVTVLVGQYAQRHYLGSQRMGSMTETVKAFAAYGPQFFPLPRRDPSAAAAYGQLKKQLAEQFPTDVEGYMSGKTEFLLDLLRSAGVPDTDLLTIRHANRRQ